MNRSTLTQRFGRFFIWLLVCSLLTTSCQDHLPPPLNYDLDVTLRGTEKAAGSVKFRQIKGLTNIYLDVSVQGLEPNTNYVLQRAVDTILDVNCTSTTWLTLGRGTVTQAILTDNLGSGSAGLFRDVSAIAAGATFDIHFQVINQQTSAVVLTSDCYRYTRR